jgi:hypothetical protein
MLDNSRRDRPSWSYADKFGTLAEEHTMTAALTKLAIVAIPVAGVGLLLSQAVETLTALASSLV